MIIEDKSWPSHSILTIVIPFASAILGIVIAIISKNRILAYWSIIVGLIILLVVMIAYLVNSKLFINDELKDYKNLNDKYTKQSAEYEKSKENLKRIKEEKDELKLKSTEYKAEIAWLKDKVKNSIDPAQLSKEESENYLRQHFKQTVTNSVPSNSANKKSSQKLN